MHRITLWTRPFGGLLILMIAVQAGAQDIPREGTFTGRWEVVGNAQKIDLGTDRTVTVAKFQGAVVLEGGERGLSRGFRAECVGLQDRKTGGIGRCVWKDLKNDEIWSEIEGEGSITARTSRGQFVGGTGKFEGIEGEFEFDWVYMIPAAEEGPVKGFATDLSGNWKLP